MSTPASIIPLAMGRGRLGDGPPVIEELVLRADRDILADGHLMARDRGPNSGDGSLQPTHAGLRGGRSCRHSTALRPSMGFKGADPNLAPDTLAHRLGPLPRESDLPSVAPARNPWYPIGTCHGHGEALGCPWRSGNRGRVTSCRLEAPPPTEGAIGEGRFRVRSAPPQGAARVCGRSGPLGGQLLPGCVVLVRTRRVECALAPPSRRTGP